MCAAHVGRQKTACKSQFSPFIMWVLGIEFGSSLAAGSSSPEPSSQLNKNMLMAI